MHAMNSVLVYYQRHQQNHFTAQNLCFLWNQWPWLIWRGHFSHWRLFEGWCLESK